mmetsp:Transcript_128434/g.363481  ORF Transcript_128434/g.363481 Transcript_128434/m.363481 type:complete len:461 (+) Transcript_128434:101-1483(+)
MGAGTSSGHDDHVTPLTETTDTPARSDSQLSSKRGLASRRGLSRRLSQPLKVATRVDILSRFSFLGKFPHVHSHDHHGVKLARHIRRTNDFEDIYTLGADLMPSGHSKMWVRHAMRNTDGARFVVKVREKAGSFSNAEDEAEWRTHTEFMLNLPKSDGIARLYDVFEDAEQYYVVMEKVEGMDLFETLDFHGRFPIKECREIIRQLLVAVADLHQKGYIHRDLKLENVMIDTPPVDRGEPPTHWSLPSAVPSEDESEGCGCDMSPKVKLIDFDTCEKCALSHAAKTVVGTDQYIAQEAYAGKYSPASDIFAVGVIAYRLLTGRFPFNPGIFDDVAGENWVGSPKMFEIQDRLRHFEIDWSLAPFTAEPQALDLCKAMLHINENDRPQAVSALKHEWFAHAHHAHGSSPPRRGASFTKVAGWSHATHARTASGKSITSASTAATMIPHKTNTSGRDHLEHH